MDMATASIRTFIKWKKHRGKWSPNILAEYCWILIRTKLAKVKYKRWNEFLQTKYFVLERSYEETIFTICLRIF